MERPLYFTSNGKRLFGLLHDPGEARRSVGIVFLNAGPQTHVGPQRIYVRAARRYCDAGFTCLRIDLTGVGEAEGPYPPNELDCHQAADVRGAIDLLAGRGVTSIVALGICAGARAAVRAALLDPRIDTVVCWSAPVVSGAADVAAAAADMTSRMAARRLFRHWAGLFLQRAWWKRQLTSPEARTGGALKLRHALTALLSPARAEPATGYVSDIAALLATPRRVLFAFGERDIVPIAEFEHHFPQFGQAQQLDRSFLLVPDGDHTFTSRAAQSAIIALTLGWLNALHPSLAASTSRYNAS